MMLGWPVVMAGGRAAGAPTLNANQSSERITAAPSAPTELTAKAGDAQVILSWAAPASDGGASIIDYYIYEGTSPDGESSTPVPRSDITGCTSTATAGSCTVTALVRGLSVRDVEATLAVALGDQAAISKSTVSPVCAQIKDEYEKWAHRQLNASP